jgi:hypothetical protein
MKFSCAATKNPTTIPRRETNSRDVRNRRKFYGGSERKLINMTLNRLKQTLEENHLPFHTRAILGFVSTTR